MIECFNCGAEFGIRGEATAGDKRALSDHLEHCLPLTRWTSPRAYRVSLRRNDSSGSSREVTVYAYTAADAVTQMQVEQQGNLPGERVYRISPAC